MPVERGDISALWLAWESDPHINSLFGHTSPWSLVKLICLSQFPDLFIEDDLSHLIIVMIK